ncbi:DUF6311 domain-containing protein [Pararhizobium haloflavum]|uniref:DUF6311 domain-containing protein n=1 Tax=Pararhizobium haloflavum TaxID=2037914 RepID=UPI000C19588D|nr:DUF6311 domain-containing protein [Pararhizobium haloflavum]
MPAYGLSALMALALFLAVHPFTFILGDGEFFQVGDAPQHVSGWLLFAADAWRFPLLTTKLIDPPEGSSIILTDSIPLMALIMKPFAPLLPDDFHYIGIWQLFAWIGQGCGAVFLIRSLGCRDLLAAVAAAALALLWPAWLDRMNHTALLTHAVLLLAIGCYFRASDGWALGRSAIVFSLLSLTALLIHPYLFAMSFAFFLADFGRRILCDPHPLRTLGIGLCAVAGLALAAGALGYANAAGTQADGYAHFSMNLLAPFCAGRLVPCGPFDATGGQYEGMAYFGLGGLALVATGSLLALPYLLGTLKRHWLLVAGLVVMTLFAISNQVFLAQDRWFMYAMLPGQDLIAGIFRASGRFFWPVGYVVAFTSLAAILSQSTRATAIFVLACIAVQAIDAKQPLAHITHRAHAEDRFDFAQWQDAGFGFRKVSLSPAYGCAPAVENMKYLYFQMVAAEAGASIDNGYLARTDADCSGPGEDPLQEGTLHVSFARQADVPLEPAVRTGLADGTCAEWTAWSAVIVCYPGATREDWQKIDLPLTVAR